MQHDPFDPAAWLARWKAAGGGWAGTHLLPGTGDPETLNALARELDDGRREALGFYLAKRNKLAVIEPEPIGDAMMMTHVFHLNAFLRTALANMGVNKTDAAAIMGGCLCEALSNLIGRDQTPDWLRFLADEMERQRNHPGIVN